MQAVLGLHVALVSVVIVVIIVVVVIMGIVDGLYEISIFLVSRVEKKRDAKLREDGYFDDENVFDDALKKNVQDDNNG